MTEMAIQQLLMEAGVERRRPGSGHGRAARPRGGGRLADAPVARDVRRLRPGDAASRRRTSRASMRPHAYARASRLRLNHWALVGRLDGRAATRPCSTSPAAGSRSASTRATSTWSWDRPRKGTSDPVPRLPRRPSRRARTRDDVDADGSGTLDEQRTYQLIRQPGAIADRTVRDRVRSRPASRPTASLRLSPTGATAARSAAGGR